VLVLAGWGGAPTVSAQVRQFRVDPQISAVRLLVYRRGALSVLAHDHVLVAKDVQGRISVDGGDLGRSTVSLRVGAAAFEVDAPAERQKAGFLSELTDGNRKSILETMTGPEVLDAAQWPAVTAASERVSGRLPDLTLAMRVKVRDREQVLNVPLLVTVSPTQLTAKGSVDLLQSAFGITPYETLFGAIAVQDKIVVQFDIVAVP
jgi:polyisoprenoid-binding protein YceI